MAVIAGGSFSRCHPPSGFCCALRNESPLSIAPSTFCSTPCATAARARPSTTTAASALEIRILFIVLLMNRRITLFKTNAFVANTSWPPADEIFAIQCTRPYNPPAMPPKLKILFLCTGNSCRSQMAEGWARQLKSAQIEAYSAGIETHGLNPNAVRVMAEAGVDISRQRSKHINELADVPLDFVITVCSHANESCPVFTGR